MERGEKEREGRRTEKKSFLFLHVFFFFFTLSKRKKTQKNSIKISTNQKNKKRKTKKVVDPDRPEAVDLRDVRVVAKLGGTVDDSELVDGLVFDQRSARGAGGPTRVENAKIALIQFCLSPPKTDLDNSVVVSDYAAMDRVLRDERNHVLG